MLTTHQDVEFKEEGRECSYFDNEVSDIRYRYMNDCSEEEALAMLERGWRRFGRMHFVPECRDCDKCISMRVDVKNYEFTKSQKRVIAKNKDTKIYINTPSLSLDHLRLYDKYHLHMSGKKDWNFNSIDIDEYRRSYVEGSGDYRKELLYVREDRLIGVALVDILQEGLSSIYCFYDHDYEKYSIGKFSILAQIRIAKELNIPYIYLGYWIKGHFSMGYKDQYKPFEILVNRPTIDEEPIWRKYE